MDKRQPFYRRFAWVLHLLVSLALVSSGLYIVTIPAERNAGFLFLGFAALGLLLSLGGFRRARESFWSLMWVYPVTNALIGVSMVIGDEAGIGSYYLILALLGVVAQVLSLGNFRSSAA